MTFYDLNNLVDYNYWARDRVLDAVSALTPEQFTCDLGNSFSSVRDTIAHICDAEYIWVTRWRGGQPIGFQKAERIADVASARAEWVNLEAGVRARTGSGGSRAGDRVQGFSWGGPIQRVLGNAATRGESRQLSSRTNHNHAPPAWRQATAIHGHDCVLSGAAEQKLAFNRDVLRSLR